MKTLNISLLVNLILLLLLFFAANKCNKGDVSAPKYIYDTTLIKGQVDTFNLLKIKYVSVPSDIDTAEVLKDYFSKKTFDFEIYEKNNFRFKALPTISKNEINKIDYEFTNLRPTAIINQSKPRAYFSAGLDVSTNISNYGSLTPKLAYTSKKRNTIAIGYDLVNKSYVLGGLFVIDLRKDNVK